MLFFFLFTTNGNACVMFSHSFATRTSHFCLNLSFYYNKCHIKMSIANKSKSLVWKRRTDEGEQTGDCLMVSIGEIEDFDKSQWQHKRQPICYSASIPISWMCRYFNRTTYVLNCELVCTQFTTNCLHAFDFRRFDKIICNTDKLVSFGENVPNCKLGGACFKLHLANAMQTN